MKTSNIIYIAVFLVAGLLFKYLSSLSSVNDTKTKKIYHYFARESLMTTSENNFFNILNTIIGDKYFVFPQVRLSSILNEKIDGQTWKTALRSINQKSVDYVIADKITRKPLIAIELDDPTHDREDRQERDELVERIFSETTVPLVRFDNYRNLSHEQIYQKLFEHLS